MKEKIFMEKKSYVKPTIELIEGLMENICLVSVSRQLPPMESEGVDDDQENERFGGLNIYSVWDKD